MVNVRVPALRSTNTSHQATTTTRCIIKQILCQKAEGVRCVVSCMAVVCDPHPWHLSCTMHSGFCLQIVGFFIVEERVQAGCGEVGEGWQLNSGWEAALAGLKTRLEAACASFQDPTPLRALKDFTLLSCTALGVNLPPSTLCLHLPWQNAARRKTRII